PGVRRAACASCSTPLANNPLNRASLQDLVHETACRVHTVLQLRLHPLLQALKARLEGDRHSRPHEVCLTYVTARGRWYDVSWKGSAERSGGLVTNIGIHFFDLLIWLFGPVADVTVHMREERRM